MNEDEDEGLKLGLDDLPNEILLRIFSSLDYKTRNTALLVSKRWYVLIDQSIGRKLFVGRQCQLVPHDTQRYSHRYVDVSAISQIGVSECYFGEVEEPGQTMTLWTLLLSRIKRALFSGDSLPKFKFPYLAKSLHFDGPIPSSVFGSIVRNTVNLNQLEMHLSSFCVLTPSNVDSLGQQWKRLRELIVWGHRLTDGIFTSFYSSSEVLKNAIALLSNNFKELVEFSVEYPFDIRDDRQFTRALLNFMERHKTIEKFKICVNLSFTTEEPSDFETATDREWMREARRVSRLLPLKDLEIVVSSMKRVRLTKMWQAFIESQKSLERAVILSFRIPPGLLASVCESNKACLRELFISRILMSTSGRHHVQLDCSTFSGCEMLTRLTVEGMLSGPSEPGLISTRLLPKSLEQLELGGFYILHEDVCDIFFELPHLNNVCLTDIGSVGRFGVTTEILQHIIMDRRIQIVSIYRSFCGQFPAGGIPNGDPNTDEVIRQRPYEILELKLNDAGYYENVRRESLFDQLTDD